MSDRGGPTDTVGRADTLEEDSFDALLREAAQTSHVAAGAPRLRAGSSLLDGRFEVLGTLGSGGMGVVCEAYDQVRKTRVALKTLFRLDPGGIYRLKNEFRALSDVVHPNLVRLQELFADGELWFFSMDLVDGTTFVDHVRPAGELDPVRLRDALAQLARAVFAIHEAGKLHRDLKPSNVRVTPEGRVVVLDFGLASDPEAGGVGQTVVDDRISGTPAYMAPEQAAGQAAVEASDWYAVGVMLFEALSGALPFEDTGRELMVAKQMGEAPALEPATAADASDLAQLCSRLLRRAPEERPGGVEVLRALGAAPLEVRASSQAPASAPGDELIGREAELSTLRDAYQASRRGQPSVVLVSGESGMGKSALVQGFVDELQRDGRAVVLRGRCYEREAVPFKALDAVIDALSRYLRRLPREAAIALMPREVFALSRLFPALERVEVVAEAPARDIDDGQELRRRAFAAFGEILGRIRDRHPLVIYIDDLQWTDRDSTVFLRYLVSHAEPVPILFVASYRSEELSGNALLTALLGWIGENAAVGVSRVEVGPLSEASSAELAAKLFGDAQITDRGRFAGLVARESGGSPFFVGELVRYAREDPDARLSQLSLSQALLARVGRLPEPSRLALELLAVSGRPMDAQALLRAAGAGDDGHQQLDRLRGAMLIRGEVGGSVECYHDKIRESVAGALNPDALRDRHAALARAEAESDAPDPEALAEHYAGAGERHRAAEQFVAAAARADEQLAFERAAKLRERALSLGSFAEERVRELTIELADALASAGRGVEAAEAYLRAADGAESVLALELKRRAAERLMTAGALARGRALIDQVLGELGMPPSRSEGVATASLLWQRAMLRVGGLGFRERRAEDLDPLELVRVDATHSCAFGLAMTDNIRGAAYQTRHLRQALKLGEPYRAARAMLLEYAFIARLGTHNAARAEALYAIAERLVDRVDDPYLRHMFGAFRTIARACQGDFAGAIASANEAIPGLQAFGQRAAYDITIARCFAGYAHFWRGELAEQLRLVQGPADEADQRNDAYSLVTLTTGIHVHAWLAAGREQEAWRRHEHAAATWPDDDFDMQRLFVLWGQAYLELYRGQPETARRSLEDAAQRYRKSQLWRVHPIDTGQSFLVGSAAAGAARAGADRDAHLRQARRAAAQLGRLCWPPARTFREAVLAAVACAEGDAEAAVAALRRMVSVADANGEAGFASAARVRLGALLGGDEGAALRQGGLAALRKAGAVEPERMVEVLAPGCTLA